MFTGLVQAVGSVVSFNGRQLVLATPNATWEDSIQIGESISVNGCCLTVVSCEGDLKFDLSEETVSRTAFSTVAAGSRVNIERALRVGDRLGGHFVQGHVDDVGTLLARTTMEGGESFRFRVPESGAKYLIDKGSIAVDGISLTVVSPMATEFEVAVIPHTLSNTNLGSLTPGDKVNLEYDVLAKHVAALLGTQ